LTISMLCSMNAHRSFLSSGSSSSTSSNHLRPFSRSSSSR
jgi:hypothetical protein